MFQATQNAIKLFLFAIVFLLFSNTAEASHMMGADIRYVCLGNNQYRVTMSLYRDCSGIGMSTTQSLAISSASCGLTLTNVVLTAGTRFGTEVSPVCPAQISNTRCNGGTLPGVQVYEYTGVITLPQACRDWRLSWSECCRNGSITNLQTQPSLYVEAFINNTSGRCNNSASFSSLPVPYICAGQPFSYNHGAIDIDGDTLIYQLINPMDAGAVPINFNAGLSASQPFVTTPAQGMTFSTSTGQMTFTPSGAQIAVVAVRVYEIRNGDTIGITMRDIQVVVLNNCTNQALSNTPPIVNAGGSYDPATRSFIVCAGDTLVFNVCARDPNGDSLSIDPNYTNIGTVFGAGNVSIFSFYPLAPASYDSICVFIRIVTDPNRIGVNSFTLTLTDNACPIPLPAFLGFNVVVPGVDIIVADTAICAGIAQNIQMNANTFTSSGGAANGTFQWSQVSGPPVTFSNTTIRNPVVSVPATTVPGDSIVILAQFTTAPDPVTGTQCFTSDRVVIRLVNTPLFVDAMVPDTSLCQNGLPNQVQFTTTVAGPAINSTSGIYTWTANPPVRVADLSSTSIPNPLGNIAGSAGQVAQYIVQYSYGLCVGRDTVQVRFKPGTVDVTPAFDTICPGDSTILTAILSDTFKIINTICDQYTVSQIPFAPIAGAGTPVAGLNCDDCVSGNLPIGFTFKFFCNNYTQFRLSSNGFLTFDLTSTNNGCCSGQNLPSAAAPNNLIAFAWEDLNPGSCGAINSFVTGTAPNRRLVVNYNGVCFFGSTNTVTVQTILYETTNIVEIHITNIPTDGNMTQGIENMNGTRAYTVPGRNSQVFSATNQAWRFAPPTPLIFAPITYNWAPNTAISNTTTQSTQVWPSGTLTYYATVSEGNCAMVDSAKVVVRSNVPPPTITCGNPVNYPTEILFNWGGSPGAAGWEYSLDSGRTWVFANLADSSLLLTGFTNGDCFQIQVRATGGAGTCLINAATIYTCCTRPCVNPTRIAIVDTIDLSCNMSGDGVIRLLGLAGDLGPNYTFNLYNLNGTLAQGPVVTNDTATFSGLSIGTYYAVATDAFGCRAFSDTMTLTQPAVYSASLTGTTITRCWNSSDGTATVAATGGTAPYSYLWSSNAANQTTSTATGLAMGTYSMTSTDANGCSSVVNNINIIGPFGQAPFVSLSLVNSTACPGNGSATVLSVQSMSGNPTPGSPNSLVYNWSNGASNVTSVNGLLAGNYSLTITDTLGCTNVSNFVINGAAIRMDSFRVTQPTCNLSNGSIRVFMSGDMNGYNFNWSNGISNTTGVITGLAAGSYTVSVVGFGGCQTQGSFNLVDAGVTAVVTGLNERVCLGASTGSIDITTTSFGGGALTYLWSNGATTEDISGLPAGTYTVTVTLVGAPLACQATAQATIRESDVPLTTSAYMNSCDDRGVGVISVTAAGGWGEPAYTYLWNNGATAVTLSGVAPGTYSVTTTDVVGCTATSSVSFSVPSLAAFITTAGQTADTLPIGLNANISAGPNTPEPGVDYTWSPANEVAAATMAQTVTNINAVGSYMLIVHARTTFCSAYDTVYVVFEEVTFNGMPSAFTPNNDGNNDVFRPVNPSKDFIIHEFKVFNRWGQMMYDGASNNNAGWDGNLNGVAQPRDVYIYSFLHQFPGEEKVLWRGQVTLLR